LVLKIGCAYGGWWWACAGGGLLPVRVNGGEVCHFFRMRWGFVPRHALGTSSPVAQRLLAVALQGGGSDGL